MTEQDNRQMASRYVAMARAAKLGDAMRAYYLGEARRVYTQANNAAYAARFAGKA